MFSRSKIQQILAVTMLGVSFFGLFNVELAWALPDIAANRVKIQTVDTHCTAAYGTSQGNPAGDNVWSAWATDVDGWDPDCVRVYIDNNLENEVDIQVCIQTSDGTPGGSLSTTECTPWAADIEAGIPTSNWSDWAADPDKWAYDSIRIKVNTRSMPGRYITNYRLGVQNSRATGDDCTVGTGTAAYTPTFAAGGGWSAWAPDALSEGSIACTRIKMDNVTIVGMPCTFNGSPVNSGSSVGATAAPLVNNGSSCLYETRTCTNGVLSGSYAYPNPPGCSVSPQTPAPTGVSASCNAGTVSMSWNAYSGATYYPRIYSLGSCSAGWTLSGNTCQKDGYAGTSDTISAPLGASYSVYAYQYTTSGGLSPASGTVGVTCYSPPNTTMMVSINSGTPYVPSGTVNVNPTDNVSFTWSGTNPTTSCSKSAGPADFLVSNTTGPDGVSPPAAGVTTSYGVQCTNTGGTDPTPATISIRTKNPCTIGTTSYPSGYSGPFFTTDVVAYGQSCPASATRSCDDTTVTGGTPSHIYPTCGVDPNTQAGLSLTVNGNFSSTTTVRKGSQATVAWNGGNSNACSVNGIGTFTNVSGTALPSSALTGSSVVTIDGKTIFNLSCTKITGGQSQTRTMTINIVPALIEI